VEAYYAREGRGPTRVELAGLAQSWSEHCSYKSSRPLMREHFGRLPADPRVLARGDAGVMALDEEWAYALRIESHNHPSAVEPYGGAATGIGGILRDVLAMGAKPVALVDPLFFGPLKGRAGPLPRGIKPPRYLFENVVAGIRDYGNRVGVPTVAGSVLFDPAYTVNPLVNVGCVGVLPRSRLLPNRATAVGQVLVLAGGRTGRDGIGGVAFASRELTSGSAQESRGAVQLGNPILKEPLIHACLEAADRHLIAGMKDLGGGGLATASGELVHAGGFGQEIRLDRVPLRERGLDPWEIWISESQERMLLAVEPGNVPALLAIFRRWDVPATPIGRVTGGGRERLFHAGRTVGEMDLAFRLDPPVPRLARTPPAPPAPEGRPVPPPDLARAIVEMLGDPNGLSREGIIRLYDHEVQGRTVGKPLVGHPATPTHADAAVLEFPPGGPGGLAIAVGSQPFLCDLDPRRGGAAAVEEAAANLYAVGATPDALTDCLNFGNPGDPRVLGSLDAVLAGMAEAAASLNVPIPSGNVSLYNGGLGSAIPPTPVVLAVGRVRDVDRVLTSPLKRPGDLLYLLGPNPPGLSGSLFQRRRGGPGGGFAPAAGPGLPRMGEALLELHSAGALSAAHDVSEGGLAQCLCEMAFGGGLGFDVDLSGLSGTEDWVPLFSEGGPRWVLEVPPQAQERVEAGLSGFPLGLLGRVEGRAGRFRHGPSLLAELDLPGLFPRWQAGFYPAEIPSRGT
jgi:phosphoribosylformylglycinamidine synthase II